MSYGNTNPGYPDRPLSPLESTAEDYGTTVVPGPSPLLPSTATHSRDEESLRPSSSSSSNYTKALKVLGLTNALEIEERETKYEELEDRMAIMVGRSSSNSATTTTTTKANEIVIVSSSPSLSLGLPTEPATNPAIQQLYNWANQPFVDTAISPIALLHRDSNNNENENDTMDMEDDTYLLPLRKQSTIDIVSSGLILPNQRSRPSSSSSSSSSLPTLPSGTSTSVSSGRNNTNNNGNDNDDLIHNAYAQMYKTTLQIDNHHYNTDPDHSFNDTSLFPSGAHHKRKHKKSLSKTLPKNSLSPPLSSSTSLHSPDTGENSNAFTASPLLLPSSSDSSTIPPSLASTTPVLSSDSLTIVPSTTDFMDLEQGNIFLSPSSSRISITIIDVTLLDDDHSSSSSSVSLSPSLIKNFTKIPYAVYLIKVRCGLRTWLIQRRYKEFVVLHRWLSTIIPASRLPQLPGKLLGLSSINVLRDPHALQQRMTELQAYLRLIIRCKEAWSSDALLVFLDDARRTLALQAHFAKMMKMTEALAASAFVQNRYNQQLAEEAVAADTALQAIRGRLQRLASVLREQIAESKDNTPEQEEIRLLLTETLQEHGIPLSLTDDSKGNIGTAEKDASGMEHTNDGTTGKDTVSPTNSANGFRPAANEQRAKLQAALGRIRMSTATTASSSSGGGSSSSETDTKNGVHDEDSVQQQPKGKPLRREFTPTTTTTGTGKDPKSLFANSSSPLSLSKLAAPSHSKPAVATKERRDSLESYSSSVLENRTLDHDKATNDGTSFAISVGSRIRKKLHQGSDVKMTTEDIDDVVSVIMGSVAASTVTRRIDGKGPGSIGSVITQSIKEDYREHLPDTDKNDHDNIDDAITVDSRGGKKGWDNETISGRTLLRTIFQRGTFKIPLLSSYTHATGTALIVPYSTNTRIPIVATSATPDRQVINVSTRRRAYSDSALPDLAASVASILEQVQKAVHNSAASTDDQSHPPVPPTESFLPPPRPFRSSRRLSIDTMLTTFIQRCSIIGSDRAVIALSEQPLLTDPPSVSNDDIDVPRMTPSMNNSIQPSSKSSTNSSVIAKHSNRTSASSMNESRATSIGTGSTTTIIDITTVMPHFQPNSGTANYPTNVASAQASLVLHRSPLNEDTAYTPLTFDTSSKDFTGSSEIPTESSLNGSVQGISTPRESNERSKHGPTEYSVTGPRSIASSVAPSLMPSLPLSMKSNELPTEDIDQLVSCTRYSNEADTIVNWIAPTNQANAKRAELTHFLTCLLRHAAGLEVVPIGSTSTRTYLPDSPLDLLLLLPANVIHEQISPEFFILAEKRNEKRDSNEPPSVVSTSSTKTVSDPSLDSVAHALSSQQRAWFVAANEALCKAAAIGHVNRMHRDTHASSGSASVTDDHPSSSLPFEKHKDSLQSIANATLDLREQLRLLTVQVADDAYMRRYLAVLAAANEQLEQWLKRYTTDLANYEAKQQQAKRKPQRSRGNSIKGKELLSGFTDIASDKASVASGLSAENDGKSVPNNLTVETNFSGTPRTLSISELSPSLRTSPSITPSVTSTTTGRRPLSGRFTLPPSLTTLEEIVTTTTTNAETVVENKGTETVPATLAHTSTVPNDVTAATVNEVTAEIMAVMNDNDVPFVTVTDGTALPDANALSPTTASVPNGRTNRTASMASISTSVSALSGGGNGNGTGTLSNEGSSIPSNNGSRSRRTRDRMRRRLLLNNGTGSENTSVSENNATHSVTNANGDTASVNSNDLTKDNASNGADTQTNGTNHTKMGRSRGNSELVRGTSEHTLSIGDNLLNGNSVDIPHPEIDMTLVSEARVIVQAAAALQDLSLAQDSNLVSSSLESPFGELLQRVYGLLSNDPTNRKSPSASVSGNAAKTAKEAALPITNAASLLSSLNNTNNPPAWMFASDGHRFAVRNVSFSLGYAWAQCENSSTETNGSRRMCPIISCVVDNIRVCITASDQYQYTSYSIPSLQQLNTFVTLNESGEENTLTMNNAYLHPLQEFGKLTTKPSLTNEPANPLTVSSSQVRWKPGTAGPGMETLYSIVFEDMTSTIDYVSETLTYIDCINHRSTNGLIGSTFHVRLPSKVPLGQRSIIKELPSVFTPVVTNEHEDSTLTSVSGACSFDALRNFTSIESSRIGSILSSTNYAALRCIWSDTVASPNNGTETGETVDHHSARPRPTAKSMYITRVPRKHLFKRSLLLIHAWIRYELEDAIRRQYLQEKVTDPNPYIPPPVDVRSFLAHAPSICVVNNSTVEAVGMADHEDEIKCNRPNNTIGTDGTVMHEESDSPAISLRALETLLLALFVEAGKGTVNDANEPWRRYLPSSRYFTDPFQVFTAFAGVYSTINFSAYVISVQQGIVPVATYLTDLANSTIPGLVKFIQQIQNDSALLSVVTSIVSAEVTMHAQTNVRHGGNSKSSGNSKLKNANNSNGTTVTVGSNTVTGTTEGIPVDASVESKRPTVGKDTELTLNEHSSVDCSVSSSSAALTKQPSKDGNVATTKASAIIRGNPANAHRGKGAILRQRLMFSGGNNGSITIKPSVDTDETVNGNGFPSDLTSLASDNYAMDVFDATTMVQIDLSSLPMHAAPVILLRQRGATMTQLLRLYRSGLLSKEGIELAEGLLRGKTAAIPILTPVFDPSVRLRIVMDAYVSSFASSIAIGTDYLVRLVGEVVGVPVRTSVSNTFIDTYTLPSSTVTDNGLLHYGWNHSIRSSSPSLLSLILRDIFHIHLPAILRFGGLTSRNQMVALPDRSSNHHGSTFLQPVLGKYFTPQAMHRSFMFARDAVPATHANFAVLTSVARPCASVCMHVADVLMPWYNITSGVTPNGMDRIQLGLGAAVKQLSSFLTGSSSSLTTAQRSVPSKLFPNTMQAYGRGDGYRQDLLLHPLQTRVQLLSQPYGYGGNESSAYGPTTVHGFPIGLSSTMVGDMLRREHPYTWWWGSNINTNTSNKHIVPSSYEFSTSTLPYGTLHPSTAASSSGSGYPPSSSKLSIRSNGNAAFETVSLSNSPEVQRILSIKQLHHGLRVVLAHNFTVFDGDLSSLIICMNFAKIICHHHTTANGLVALLSHVVGVRGVSQVSVIGKLCQEIPSCTNTAAIIKVFFGGLKQFLSRQGGAIFALGGSFSFNPSVCLRGHLPLYPHLAIPPTLIHHVSNYARLATNVAKIFRANENEPVSGSNDGEVNTVGSDATNVKTGINGTSPLLSSSSLSTKAFTVKNSVVPIDPEVATYLRSLIVDDIWDTADPNYSKKMQEKLAREQQQQELLKKTLQEQTRKAKKGSLGTTNLPSPTSGAEDSFLIKDNESITSSKAPKGGKKNGKAKIDTSTITNSPAISAVTVDTDTIDTEDLSPRAGKASALNSHPTVTTETVLRLDEYADVIMSPIIEIKKNDEPMATVGAITTHRTSNTPSTVSRGENSQVPPRSSVDSSNSRYLPRNRNTSTNTNTTTHNGSMDGTEYNPNRRKVSNGTNPGTGNTTNNNGGGGGSTKFSRFTENVRLHSTGRGAPNSYGNYHNPPNGSNNTYNDYPDYTNIPSNGTNEQLQNAAAAVAMAMMGAVNNSMYATTTGTDPYLSTYVPNPTIAEPSMGDMYGMYNNNTPTVSSVPMYPTAPSVVSTPMVMTPNGYVPVAPTYTTVPPPTEPETTNQGPEVPATIEGSSSTETVGTGTITPSVPSSTTLGTAIQPSGYAMINGTPIPIYTDAAGNQFVMMYPTAPTYAAPMHTTATPSPAIVSSTSVVDAVPHPALPSLPPAVASSSSSTASAVVVPNEGTETNNDETVTVNITVEVSRTVPPVMEGHVNYSSYPPSPSVYPSSSYSATGPYPPSSSSPYQHHPHSSPHHYERYPNGMDVSYGNNHPYQGNHLSYYQQQQQQRDEVKRRIRTYGPKGGSNNNPNYSGFNSSNSNSNNNHHGPIVPPPPPLPPSSDASPPLPPSTVDRTPYPGYNNAYPNNYPSSRASPRQGNLYTNNRR